MVHFISTNLQWLASNQKQQYSHEMSNPMAGNSGRALPEFDAIWSKARFFCVLQGLLVSWRNFRDIALVLGVVHSSFNYWRSSTWLSPVGHPPFEELSFSDNQPFSFSTSNPEELGVAKFSQRIFHLAPDEIHPLALLIPTALGFYYMFCVVVAVKRHCCEDTLFSRVQASKPILQFSFSILATSKRGVIPPSCTRTPHWLPFSLTTFSFSKKFGSLEKV